MIIRCVQLLAIGAALMLAGPVLALVGGNNGGWGGADTDGWLQNPPDSLELGAAFGVNAANEMLVGDPGQNQVAIYLDANLEMPADDDSWAEHEYAWLVDWPDADPDDRVGSAIAVWGGAALVGAPGDGNGRVYILQRDGGPGANWIKTGSIDPPTDQPNWAGFGATIAMDPPYILIGAPDGSEEGVARYKINGINIDHEHSWTSPYPGTDAGFGTALAINGTRAIIGAPDADDGYGSAWLYAQEGGAGPWNLQGDYATISPIGGRLGAGVFLSDQFAGVAAPDASNPNSNQGIVWFFHCTQDDFWDSTGDGECDGWAMPPAEFSGGGFGTALVNRNNTMVISHTGMNDGDGGIHIFKLRPDSTENVIAWTDTISLLGNQTWGETLERAGAMLWIPGGDGAIGYLLNDGDIRLSANIAATVSAQALPTGTDWIPQSLDVEGSWMAGGASEEDQVVIMHEVDDAWSAVQVLDGPETGSLYGVTIRLLNGVLAVGAPMAAGGDGCVYLYTLDSSDQWVWQQTIVPDAANAGNRFGFGLDMCLDNLGQLVLVTVSPAIDFNSKGKIPMQFAPGRFDVYRISADASTKTALHDWTEPGIASGGVFGTSINSEGSDLIVAVGRVLRGLVDVNDPPLTWGGITIFRGGDEPDTKWTIEADIDAPESRGAFGATTDIAAGLVTTTSPYHSEGEDEGDVDLRIDVYEQDAPGDPWVATQQLRTPDIHPNHDFGGQPRITTLFGHQAIVAGSSRLQSAAGLAGSAEIFIRPGDATYGTAFRHHLRLTVQGHHDVRLGETVAIDGDNLFFAGGLFTSDDPYAGEGGVVGWARLTNTAYWNNVYGGLFEDPANWTIDPTQADRLEVSTLDSNFMMLVSSEPTLDDKPVHVRYATSMLRHDSTDFVMQLEEWTTWSDAGIQLATSSTSGGVNVTNDLRVGSGEGDAGRLLFLDGGNVTVGGSYVQASTGVLEWWGAGGQSEALITTANTQLGGTLSLLMVDPNVVFEEGEEFPIIQSSVAPTSGFDRFDLVVLPGLPDGLALQVMYDDADGGELVGDGTWDAWVQVITLAGLLGFGDADSLSVTGTPIAIEVVDLTDDGADEICVLLDGEPGQIAIFESDGSGGVALQVGVETHDLPTCIASGDFNGDGKNDLVVGTRGGIVTVFWNEDNDLSNGFVPEDLTAIGPVLCASRTNLDFDGLPDLVVGIDDTDEDGKGHLQFWAGQNSLRGLGGSLSPRGAKDSPGVAVVFGDPSDDEDQKPGALSAHQMVAFVAMSSGYGLVMTADPGNTAALPELEVHSVGANPGGVAVGDLNGDDILDVAVTSRDNGTIALLIGTGMNSGLNPAMNIPIGSSPGSIEVIDFDGDGNLDLAATTRTPDGDRVIRVLQNDGGLSFTSVDTGLDSSPTLLSKGDIHGDDVTRLVSIGSPAGLLAGTNVMDLHNVESEPCLGDTDGNGVVDIEDLLNVIAQFGNDCEADEECWADGDDDGDIDIEDLLIVIGGFGAC